MTESDGGISDDEKDSNEEDKRVGMISHKKSLITNSNSLRFWFVFGIKLRILNQNYIKND